MPTSVYSPVDSSDTMKVDDLSNIEQNIFVVKVLIEISMFFSSISAFSFFVQKKSVDTYLMYNWGVTMMFFASVFTTATILIYFYKPQYLKSQWKYSVLLLLFFGYSLFCLLFECTLEIWYASGVFTLVGGFLISLVLYSYFYNQSTLKSFEAMGWLFIFKFAALGVVAVWFQQLLPEFLFCTLSAFVIVIHVISSLDTIITNTHKSITFHKNDDVLAVVSVLLCNCPNINSSKPLRV